MSNQYQHPLDKQIISVGKLLAEETLNIPNYQRPYKWTEKNLNDLFSDIQRYHTQPAYRLGTVVFHHHKKNEKEVLDIVDGQQRILTLMLLLKAIKEEKNSLPDNLAQQLKELSPAVDKFMENQSFASTTSHQNLYHNYQASRRTVARPDFTEKHIDFLLNQCELVTFVLDDISEAFQFFDSQNSRGRDLNPHDLLKAFHLREFAESEQERKAQTVAHWEDQESRELAQLFGHYLYRIRQWSQDKSARYFSKNNVDLFKGVNLDRDGVYPYAEMLRIAHHYTDHRSQINRQIMPYPFQLDQTILNGRRFFEMVRHYQKEVSKITTQKLKTEQNAPLSFMGIELEETASRILSTLNSYPARIRTGDKYVRNLFDCALIFYIDKFGTIAISKIIEKLFIWAYSLRLQKASVYLASTDNYALDSNLFTLIRYATTPNELLSLRLNTAKANDESENHRLNEIIQLFKDLKYYE